ncbi:putative DNA binding domain-containing protein [Achromobacter sp. GG226]|uniref:ATP-binding protein n=1 Tax=Verticiella alkaliphila TaxID=2779529 RepID=UPI001C0C33DD|nr:ATP-binding protein [Verticiella sp. GG226]MBU4612216.1 putative DNA binding domain-containing protein [Verticiella sp. GG226]
MNEEIRYPRRLQTLVQRLISEDAESEWLEFKAGNENPSEIGEYISALANSATICGKSHGYVIWGVDDESREIVGTAFRPAEARRGNEALEAWLLRSLVPQVSFHFYELTVDAKRVVILKVARASNRPVAFFGTEFIRVSSYKKPLKEAPEKERVLWRLFDAVPFERHAALVGLSEGDVTQLLDYPAYFDLRELPLPEHRQGILQALADDRLIEIEDEGDWAITNLGAVLFARRLSDFERLGRKAVRVIRYGENGRVSSGSEHMETRGYASGFRDLLAYIHRFVPNNEIIGQALRRATPMYPEIAIRELIANALIHQDFTITGAGPLVEIFPGRIEITNPGTPLMPVDRLLDKAPRSRNEALAALMRRFGVCEERGSGIDKVVQATEMAQLPAPEFRSEDDSFRSTLFSYSSYNQMDKADKIRATYLHASLRYVQRDMMTNTSLRERFGIPQANSAIVSRLIKDTVETGLIHPHDENAGRRFMRYVPHWAKSA